MRTPVIAGNWKMYKTCAEAEAFARDLLSRKKDGWKAADGSVPQVLIAPPYPQIQTLSACFAGSGVGVLAQNMHEAKEGAFTGEVSGEMLVELGACGVILGHSERRQYFGETDERVNRKAAKALALGLLPVVCVGEAMAVREAGFQNRFVEQQVEAALQGLSAEDAARLVIAYEPIWAIGTGIASGSGQAQQMCAFIRGVVRARFGRAADEMRILYGGSVKPGNAGEFFRMPDIDGALVGGASLSAADFDAILRA